MSSVQHEAEGRSLPSGHLRSAETQWLRWGRSAFALLVVVSLAALAIANIVTHARWHEVEDGVLWAERAEGVSAVDVAQGSPAARAGIERGDVLLAVNNAPIRAPADVIEYQHTAREGTRLNYALARLGRRELVNVT